MNIEQLKTELRNDPLARGYAGMTVQQVADSLNAVDRQITRDALLSIESLVQRFGFAMAKKLWQAIEAADPFLAKMLDRGVVNLNDPDVVVSINAIVGDAAKEASAASTLVGLTAVVVSRADEIGAGYVNWQDVTFARNLLAKEI